MTSMPKPGDRIRLIAMHKDPDPIQTGSVGTVVRVDRHGGGRETWHQIDVDWDNGRRLMLVSPPDQFVIVGASDDNA